MSFDLAAAQIRAILLDVEGTTTPIAFVHETLFRFAREHVKDFLENNFDSLEVQRDLATLQAEHDIEKASEPSPPALACDSRVATIESFIRYINWLMDRDRKSAGLKSLQGKIWQQAYIDGVLESQVFPDVPLALERWRRSGLSLNIFSSGSVLAQKLLFTYTDHGDLTKFLDHYFDTTTGVKTASTSYEHIAAVLKLNPVAVLFISDVTSELDAARKAGMQTLLSIRPGNPPQIPSHAHPAIQGFDEIQ